MFKPDAASLAAASAGRPPSPGALARVPSAPTPLPAPVLAIDLAVLAAHIAPDYPVERLRAALVAAARPGSQGLTAADGGAGDYASIIIGQDDGADEEDGGGAGGKDGDGDGDGGLVAAALLVAGGRDDGYDREDFFRFDEDASFSLPAAASLSGLAMSLHAVPGSLLEGGGGASPGARGGRGCEDTPLEPRNPLADAELHAVPMRGARASRSRRDGDVSVTLPRGAAEALRADPDTTALLFSVPEKPPRPGEPRPDPLHLLVVGDGEGSGEAGEDVALVGGGGGGGGDGRSTGGISARYGSLASKNKESVERGDCGDGGDGSGADGVGSQRLMNIESELVVRESAGKYEAPDLSLAVTYSVNWLGYAILLVAIIASASSGTAVKMLPVVAGGTAGAWLHQVQGLLCLPLAVAQLAALSKKQRATLWEGAPTTARLIAATSLAQVAWACGYYVAMDYTSLTRAWILNNAHAVLIVLLSAASAQRTSRGEAAGAAIAVAGMLVMQLPALVGRRGVAPLAGDVLALLSSLPAIAFLELCGQLRARLPLFVFMCPLSLLNGALLSLVAAFGQGGDFGYKDSGAFGWMAPNRLLFALYLGGVVGLMGTVNCIAALAHLPPVVVSVAQTLMPPVGTTAAVMLGAEKAPGYFTTCGALVMVVGVLLIAKATSSKEVHIDLNPPEAV